MPRSRVFTMAVAYIRHIANTPNLDIIFHYRNATVGIDRVFNFSRNIDETVDCTLNRIRTNVEKEFTKKLGKKKKSKTDQSKPEPIVVDFIFGEDNSTTWSHLLKKPDDQKFKGMQLNICEQQFHITYNYPYVNQFALPTVILAGFECYPSKFEVFFTERDQCRFEWFRGLPAKKDEDIDWVKCDSESTFFYNVQSDDLAHKLKLVCTPINGDKVGEAVEMISKNVVESGPTISAFEAKHKLTAKRMVDENQFRVVSYNLLADYYADSDFSRKELFPYCPPKFLAIDYRKLLFIRELLDYNADIYCMQEVDAKIFDLDLTLCLGNAGLDGVMQKKGTTAEGIATFYRRDKFSLVQHHGINLNETLTTKSYFAGIYNKIKQNEKLIERMLSLSTALQVTVLKSTTSDRYLVVGNTHLYFHPDADHIRVLQMGLFMSFVKHICQSIISQYNLGAQQVSVIFCGDFNSVPECGVYKLMTEKCVPEDFIDFKSNAEEAVSGVELKQPFNIASAYGTPRYTNFTVGFADCLDYIFYQTDDLKLLQTAPLPTEEELRANKAIPSVLFPSDHVSLVADLEWIK